MQTQAEQLRALIFNSGKVPNTDIEMHVRAILAGDYTVQDLLANADAFYNMSGQAMDYELQTVI